MDFNKHDSNNTTRLGRFNWEDMLTTVSTSQLHNRHPKITQVTQPPANHKGTKPQTIILLANSSSSGDSLLQGRPLLQQFPKPACQLVTPSCQIHRERPQLLPIKEEATATTCSAKVMVLSHQTGPHSTGKLTPGIPFLQHYNLCICLQQQNKQALSEREVLTNLLQQLTTLDPTIVLYLWKSMDHSSKSAIRLSNKPLEFLISPLIYPDLPALSSLTIPPITCIYFWDPQNLQHYWFSNSVHGCRLQSKDCGLSNYLWLNKPNAWDGSFSWHQSTTWTNSGEQFSQLQG